MKYNTYYIYKIVNLLTGKIYIGQTTRDNPQQRWGEHCRASKVKVSALTSAINKYGKNNFTFELIDIAENINSLNEKEKFYIKYFNSISPSGYNLTEGGLNGLKSETTKNKHKIRPRTPMSLETKQKIAQKAKERANTPEGRELLLKASKAATLIPYTPERLELIRMKSTGRTLSPEARAKIGVANSLRKINKHTKQG